MSTARANRGPPQESSPLTIAELTLAVAPERWRGLGFAVARDECRVGSVSLRLAGAGAGKGLVAWSLRNSASAEFDGLPTDLIDDPARAADRHANTALHVDHVVVVTPSLDRTAAALDDAGVRLRRQRQVRTPGGPLRQGFFRLGEVVLEVVEPAAGEPSSTASASEMPRLRPSDPAVFWGLVVVVEDLDACAEVLGDRLGTPRSAVQRGRRIATVRPNAQLGVPVAFITPEPAR